VEVQFMGSVSTNPAITNLLQTISSAQSPVLSSPAVISSLENAPPQDIIQISDAATQMEGIDAEFGITPTPTDTVASDLSNVLSTLTTPATASSSSSATTAPSGAQQLATYQAALQEADTDALFGTGTSNSLSTPVFG
jgi:hypothetical protein